MKPEVTVVDANAEAIDLTGQTVGEYEVLRRIGVGGMGEVYEGRHPLIGKRVAVKVLLPELSHDPTIIERFLREAQAVNSIRHDGIVDIFSFGRLPNGAAYCVMEYLEGEPLGTYLSRNGKLPIDEALSLMAALLETLAAAHRAGIVHRDIKPSNLFLHADGRGTYTLKVLDFGIAKMLRQGSDLTNAHELLGTPEYMSPEQVMGQKVSPATDLYAAGVLLYRMLTGVKPFVGQHEYEVLRMQVHDPAPSPSWARPEVSPALDAFVLKCLAKDPTQRYATCDEARGVVLDLKAALAAGADVHTDAKATRPLPAPVVVTPVMRAPVVRSSPPMPARFDKTASVPMPTFTPAPKRSVHELATDVRGGRSSRQSLVLAVQLAGLGALLAGIWYLASGRPAEPPPAKPAPPPAVVGVDPTPPPEATAFVDAGPVEPEAEADPVVPPVVPPVVAPEPDAGQAPAPRPTGRAVKAAPTREALLKRVAKCDATLRAREAKAGVPDRVGRQFVVTVRGAVTIAKTEAQLAEAAALLKDLEAQLAE